MKKLISISLAVIMGLLLSGVSVSFAEEKKSTGSIFEFKKELGLTDQQEINLKDILAKLQGYLTDKQKELNVLRPELSKMIKEGDSLGKIKKKLLVIAKIQAEATYEDIASTRAIETELTEEQLSKWRGMQAEFAKKLKQAQEAKAAETKQKEGAK